MADEQLLRALRSIQPGDTLVVPVHGNSMEPTLRDGDRVRLESVPTGQARWGDIVAFVDEHGQLIIHRVIWRWHRCLMKGDNRRAGDGYIQPQQVIARVVSVERQGEMLWQAPLRSPLRTMRSLWQYVLTGMGRRLHSS